jgi:hypothetical protein
MKEYVVSILWDLYDFLAAQNTLCRCLVSADVGSSSEERSAGRREVIETRLISFAAQLWRLQKIIRRVDGYHGIQL